MPDIFDRLKAALADRYAIQRELGSGGMATVYLANDLEHDRNFAVKGLRPELAAAPAAGQAQRGMHSSSLCWGATWGRASGRAAGATRAGQRSVCS